ncbi:MAG TPA: sugar-transfer associated ATP-grasp domain-containing protein [Vicinamibacterales bacterium]|jgi:glutathione synthase/RimK-type ligase-like ATP-grasp enzyme
MLAEAHPAVRQFLRFCALPYCYFGQIDWRECRKSRFEVALDLLHIFFRLRYYPDNYCPCRLFEKPRADWVYYYGSSYHPWARHQLRRVVQPFDWLEFFADKATLDAHFRQHAIPMPRTYAVLDPTGDYRQLARTALAESGADRLIMKPVSGAAGRGICLLIAHPEEPQVQSRSATMPLPAYSLGERYLLQEVLTQHESIARLYPHSINTVRTLTLLTRSGEPMIISAVMRFGVGGAFVDNWSAGGVAVGVDPSEGTLMRWAYDKHGRRFAAHPTTGVTFEGTRVPFWGEVIDLSERVQVTLPDYRLVGLDVAITPAGPKVIEVNGNPDLVFQEQTAGPLLRNRRVLEEFDRYGLLTNRYQRALLTPGES